ncbi:zinc finger protein 532-like [Anneissia japonica]|uniref:zinc finger protein 532-like n=1 Tax=Anneissia japonica TaxID=1529436 RepID=UPI0014257728|nr:zinc finger protein 532-like [Anneissia japonica]
METEKPNKVASSNPNSSHNELREGYDIQDKKMDNEEGSLKIKPSPSSEKNLNAKEIKVEEGIKGNSGNPGSSEVNIKSNVKAPDTDARNVKNSLSNNVIGQLQTVATTTTLPVSIAVAPLLNRKPTQGQFAAASAVPAINSLKKSPEVGASASQALALLSEQVSVVKTTSTVSAVQAVPTSTKTSTTIAPRNTKGRKLNYKFISTTGQKASSSICTTVISQDHVNISGFESSTQIHSVNGGLSNLFKSGRKHVAKVMPDCFADKLEGSPYRCLGCGDSYTFQSSLNMHVSRRSSLIKYKCPFCNLTKHFFNKCSLFIHAREHARVTKKSFELRANLASLSLLPSQQANHFGNQGSTDAEDGIAIPGQGLVVTTEVNKTQPTKESETGSSKTGEKVVISEPQEYFKEGKKACLICMEKFSSRVSKAAHFKRETKRVVCQNCDQILINPCMAELHKNYHQHKEPLQCPDCGLVSDTEKGAYQHIQQFCFHMSRKILVRCSVCNIYVSSFKVYQNHLLDRHAESFFKCVECQLAYRSVESLKCHTVVEHRNNRNSSMCNIILKCPLCETVFGNKKQLTLHINTIHTYSDLSETKLVHECAHCGKLFQQLTSLESHMLVTHKNCADHFHCEFCNRAIQNFSELAPHKKHCSMKLHSKFKNPEDINVLISKDGDNNMKVQAGEKPEALNPVSRKMHDIHKCLHCSKSGRTLLFRSKQDLDTHCLLTHKETIAKSSSVDTASTSTVPTLTVAGSDERKRNADTADDAAPIKKLKIILPRKDFNCALCDFTCPAREDFKSHLLEKHDANGALQCQECGLSFRAVLSLKMHLRAVHKIYALNQYLDQQDTSVKEIVCSEEKTDKKTKVKAAPVGQIFKRFDSNSMECQVCYKVFDTETNLRTHMRNHGMAFIKSKRSMSLDSKDGK